MSKAGKGYIFTVSATLVETLGVAVLPVPGVVPVVAGVAPGTVPFTWKV